jgi:hypothetical protein
MGSTLGGIICYIAYFYFSVFEYFFKYLFYIKKIFLAFSFFESKVVICLCSAYAYAVFMLMHCLCLCSVYPAW